MMRPLAAALLAAMVTTIPAAAVTVIDADPVAAAPSPPQDARADAHQLRGSARPHDMTSALPEPHTWAALLVGFGLIGFAARWRRKSLPRLAD